jgi:hypothetical protein
MKLGAEPAPERTNRVKTKYNSTLSTVEAKGGDKTQNNSTRRKWSALALGGFLFISVFALSAPLAEAQCREWKVGFEWRFKQGTYQYPVEMNLQQYRTELTGRACHRVKGEIGQYYNVCGTVDGTVEGDQFAVKIEWNNETTGVYKGTIGPTGKIEGEGWEIRSPGTKIRWYSVTRMICADATSAPPPPITSTNPTPKPLKSSGKAKSAAAPFIKANPIAVTIPAGQSQGTTTLTWDGGPDHPYAEVWIKESSQGEEKFLVEQGKGTRQVTVERGKNYQFLLMDAGQQLAKAVVISRQ